MDFLRLTYRFGAAPDPPSTFKDLELLSDKVIMTEQAAAGSWGKVVEGCERPGHVTTLLRTSHFKMWLVIAT